jgi:predicted nucleotidyltransferase component of viral defense system
VIDKREVLDFSRELGLAPNVVEKDYVLGWLLAGIGHHEELSASWIFKGGTCLKKCFFETYRFSEDLDFTITDSNQLNKDFLTKAFAEISGWIYEATGIEIPRELIRFDVNRNPRGGISVEGRIAFRGPMGMGGDLPRVRLDITADEVLVLQPVMRKVHHPYSDNPPGGIEILCYAFEEVFAEKTRALKERLRPRDLYDVVHLYRHETFRPERNIVIATLNKKCEFKGISTPTIQEFMEHVGRTELESEWANMLTHQLPALPPFDQFWSELPAVFEWLYGAIERIERSAIPTMDTGIDESWRPPDMVQTWSSSVPLEIVRFAASNRLCVNLSYQGTKRLIEPYSLRRTRDGHLLLYSVRHNTGEARSYRVDRIQGAEASSVSFTPRYLVELSTSGPVSAPPIERSTSRIPRVSRPRTSYARWNTFGPTYVYECFYCGKKFYHKKHDSVLRLHKDKHGYKCSGLKGYFIDTRY